MFALLFQALATAFGCPADMSQFTRAQRSMSVSAGGETVVVCTRQGMMSIASPAGGVSHEDGTPNAPHSECALCFNHICCPSALAPPGQAAILAPSSVGIAFLVEAWRSPASADIIFLRNRGPPLSLVV